MNAQQGGPADEPEPIREFRGQGWYNIWGVLLAVFIGLLCACIYWIARLGFWGALAETSFGYEAFFAGILGLVLLGRWSIPYLLLNADKADPRNADALRMLRPGWYFREYFRRKR